MGTLTIKLDDQSRKLCGGHGVPSRPVFQIETQQELPSAIVVITLTNDGLTAKVTELFTPNSATCDLPFSGRNIMATSNAPPISNDLQSQVRRIPILIEEKSPGFWGSLATRIFG